MSSFPIIELSSDDDSIYDNVKDEQMIDNIAPHSLAKRWMPDNIETGRCQRHNNLHCTKFLCIVSHFERSLKPWEIYFPYSDQTNDPTVFIYDDSDDDDQSIDDEQFYFGLRVENFEIFADVDGEKVFDELRPTFRSSLFLSGDICALKKSQNPAHVHVERISFDRWQLCHVGPHASRSPFPTVFIPFEDYSPTQRHYGRKEVIDGVFLLLGTPSSGYSYIWNRQFMHQIVLLRLVGDWCTSSPNICFLEWLVDLWGSSMMLKTWCDAVGLSWPLRESNENQSRISSILRFHRDFLFQMLNERSVAEGKPFNFLTSDIFRDLLPKAILKPNEFLFFKRSGCLMEESCERIHAKTVERPVVTKTVQKYLPKKVLNSSWVYAEKEDFEVKQHLRIEVKDDSAYRNVHTSDVISLSLKLRQEIFDVNRPTLRLFSAIRLEMSSGNWLLVKAGDVVSVESGSNDLWLCRVLGFYNVRTNCDEFQRNELPSIIADESYEWRFVSQWFWNDNDIYIPDDLQQDFYLTSHIEFSQHISAIKSSVPFLWNANATKSIAGCVNELNEPWIYCERFWDRHTGRLTTLSKRQMTFNGAFEPLPYAAKSSLKSMKKLLDQILRCAEKIIDDDYDDPFFSVDERYRGFKNPTRPLSSLELYCGSGGLSKGLCSAGTIQPTWAIDIDEDSCRSFAHNHPDTKVFCVSTNVALQCALSGDFQGEVEAITAGCPCQGFSVVNRFAGNENGLKNNLNITTFLSFVEFYKPRFVLMENVPSINRCKNFGDIANFNFFVLALKVLSSLGYQVGYAILAAPHYGVPQKRHRMILWATERMIQLPRPPHPQYSYVSNLYQILIRLKDGTIVPGINSFELYGQGRRTIWDAIGDLPRLGDGYNPCYDDIFHSLERVSNKMRLRLDAFQRGLDDDKDAIVDDEDEEERDATDLAKRASWDGYYSTIKTRMTHMHPEEARLLSVREAALIQGYPCDYYFHGTLESQYRQIGNSVPPLMSKAIGLEAVRCWCQK